MLCIANCMCIALFHAAAMLSPRRTKAFFCPSKLVFKFFTARFDGQNVLCLCKTAAA